MVCELMEELGEGKKPQRGGTGVLREREVREDYFIHGLRVEERRLTDR